MAAPTIAQLVEVQPHDEVLKEFLHLLETSGVDITGWSTETAQYAFVWASAAFFANKTLITAEIAKSGFNDLASRDWLTFFSKSHYDNDRYEAIRTVGEMVLTPGDTASLPDVIAAGDVVVKHKSTGQTFRNTTGGTLSVSGTGVIFTFQAEVAGADGNIPLDSQAKNVTAANPNGDLQLQTPIPGVTVSNPAIAGTSDWKTTVGTNEESDRDLKARNRTKWASLAYATGPRDVYEYWARTAEPSINRVQVDDLDATATGNVTVYLATGHNTNSPGGAPAAGAAVTTVNNYINGATTPTFVPARHPLTATVTVLPAVNFPIIIGGTLYVLGRYVDGIQDKVDKEALPEFFETIPIGGFKDDPLALDGKLYAHHVFAAIAQVPGIQNVIFDTPVNILVNGLTVPKGNVCTLDRLTLGDWEVVSV